VNWLRQDGLFGFFPSLDFFRGGGPSLFLSPFPFPTFRVPVAVTPFPLFFQEVSTKGGVVLSFFHRVVSTWPSFFPLGIATPRRGFAVGKTSYVAVALDLLYRAASPPFLSKGGDVGFLNSFSFPPFFFFCLEIFSETPPATLPRVTIPGPPSFIGVIPLAPRLFRTGGFPRFRFFFVSVLVVDPVVKFPNFSALPFHTNPTG